VDAGQGTEGGVSGLAAGSLDGFDPETQELAGNLALILDDAFNLLLRKHENYGPSNIAEAPGGALNGLRVRLHDKQARWNHMLDNNKADLVGEALEETFIDALNYCAISILVLRGQWPGTETK
jgi:hypothetical protein